MDDRALCVWIGDVRREVYRSGREMTGAARRRLLRRLRRRVADAMRGATGWQAETLQRLAEEVSRG